MLKYLFTSLSWSCNQTGPFSNNIYPSLLLVGKHFKVIFSETYHIFPRPKRKMREKRDLCLVKKNEYNPCTKFLLLLFASMGYEEISYKNRSQWFHELYVSRFFASWKFYNKSKKVYLKNKLSVFTRLKRYIPKNDN